MQGQVQVIGELFPRSVSLPPDALLRLAEILVATLRKQILAGIDASGRRFPPGVDLQRSGALLASMRPVVVNGAPSVEVGVPYAPYVNARYRFDDLAPQYREELEAAWAPIIEEALRANQG